ncbi:MAG: glycerate kinase, partial [Acidimicrobiales bacterium]
MPHVVVAPDKFRGTATATAVAGAMGRAARRCGWSVAEVPLADGGEGSLDAIRRALGGELRH